MHAQSSILEGKYDDNQAGWFSFASTIAAIVGGLLVGRCNRLS